MSLLSTCCDAPRWHGLESDICESCKEHADFYDDEDDEMNEEKPEDLAMSYAEANEEAIKKAGICQELLLIEKG